MRMQESRTRIYVWVRIYMYKFTVIKGDIWFGRLEFEKPFKFLLNTVVLISTLILDISYLIGKFSTQFEESLLKHTSV